MEAIKCPNCGSEKIKEVTEEKYICLACDNVFLVHNLSKEFQKTEEHIDLVHKDLKDAINYIKNNPGNNNAEIESVFENAFHLISIGRYDEALEIFHVLCIEQSIKYKSWYGKILVLTENFANLDEDIICSDEIIDGINNMRKCKDYPKEIEDKLCVYIESVFLMAKKEIEDKLEHQQKKLELNKKHIDTENNKKETLESEIEGLQRDIEKETYRFDRWRRSISAVQVLSMIILLVLCESRVIKSLFINWVGKSLGVINSPLPEASSPEAGSALGNGFLHLLAIPFKCIVGVAIFIGIALVVWFVWSMIFDAIKDKIGERLNWLQGEYDNTIAKDENMKKEIQNLNNNQTHDRITMEKLQKRLDYYNNIDLKDTATFIQGRLDISDKK